jgi:hypothetical protein
MSREQQSVADSMRRVVEHQMRHAEHGLETALATRYAMSDASTREERELADARITIARDRIAELQTELIEADIIDTEAAVRAYERSGFASGARYLAAAAGLADRLAARAHELGTAEGDPDRTSEELDGLMREIEALHKALDGLNDGMEGVAQNTEANAEKERALRPETVPGGRLPPTVERVPGGSSGSPGGGAAGGDGCNITNILSANAFAGADAAAIGGGGGGGGGGFGIGGAGGAGGSATSTSTAAGRRRRVPDIMLAIRVTSPSGDVDEGSNVTIEWMTEGGTAPRNVTIELFAPQTSQLHPADFHPIVEGARDVGSFTWNAAVPQGHYAGLTLSSPANPVSLPGFYIRVTVTDASGQSASDTTPTFAIIRR